MLSLISNHFSNYFSNYDQLKSILVGLLVLGGLSSCFTDNRPNVLIIVLDDFGYNDLAFHTNIAGDTQPLYTPNLDTFASGAGHFSRHYTESTCSPSRAALLTGRYPARAGFTSNGRGISPETITLAERFQESNYRTHFLGKWHTGDTTELALPHYQGFSSWLGFPNQWMTREKYSRDLNNLKQPTYENPWLQDERGEVQQYQGHLNNIISNSAISFIGEQESTAKPWFLQVSFYAPHEPIKASANFQSQYPDTAEGNYRALVHQLDSNIGLILEELENSSESENTLVVIVSDNGGISQRYPSNLPFAGQKASYYEGGVRTPLLVKWLDDDLNAKSYPYAVSIMDLYPTLLSAVGISYNPSEIDGRNLLPFLREGEPINRQLYWEILNQDEYLFSVLSNDQRWRYSTGFLNGQWLLDLDNDFGGYTNVLADNQSVATELVSDYRNWHNEVHRVETKFDKQLANGGGVLTGDSFQRSPGFGGYTFALGINTQGQRNEKNIIASQADLFSVYLDDETLEINLQDAHLEMPFPIDSQCHSLIITAQHNARISWILGPAPMETPIDVYIDGELQTSRIDGREMPKEADFLAPTYIGHWPGDDNQTFLGNLSEPIIYNHRVFPQESSGRFSFDSLENEVCSSD